MNPKPPKAKVLWTMYPVIGALSVGGIALLSFLLQLLLLIPLKIAAILLWCCVIVLVASYFLDVKLDPQYHAWLRSQREKK